MHTTQTVRRPKAAPRLSTAVQLIARRLHFLAGIVVAPFLAILCLTGLVYVFSPQIHDSLYHSDLHVSRIGGTPRPLAEQIEPALRAHPEARLKAVLTAPAPDRTTRVVLSVPGPPGTPDRTVFIDPYTGYINGELATVENRLPANTWLRQLHSDLHLGQAGRLYAELTASWLPLIVLGGLALWLARTRRKRRLREVLLPAAQGKKGWQRLRALHGAAGLWLAAGLLVASVTGLAMSQFAGGRADQGFDPIHLRAPVLAAAPVAIPQGPQPIGLDQALSVAETAGLTGELSVIPPAGPGAPFTVTEVGEGLPVHREAVAIDPYTAKVTERVGWGDYSVAAKLSLLGTEFHTGSLFGLANQIVLTVLAAGTLVLLALGYRMWWIHNPYRGRWASLPRPLWRQLPRPAMIVVLLAVTVLAWFLPVFGASLVVFVAVDAVLARFKRPARENAVRES
ncbi:PepSY domain-containing protein [Amycolatopsis sp.]|uniref:PepSY-associated TM helix domain-containing protein n=1 Tax=Amycolatopsis sp. TaxID=37632 RepID=UPI002BE871AF|nr:PepSY domain-containing protein [Amycolatopsis sp.]HVV14472.1 PepSY domain-containing protein [Amycolatopsis sp.]